MLKNSLQPLNNNPQWFGVDHYKGMRKQHHRYTAVPHLYAAKVYHSNFVLIVSAFLETSDFNKQSVRVTHE